MLEFASNLITNSPFGTVVIILVVITAIASIINTLIDNRHAYRMAKLEAAKVEHDNNDGNRPQILNG